MSCRRTEPLGVRFDERHIVDAQGSSSGACLVEHLRGHVNAGHAPGGADHLGGDERVRPRTGSKVEHTGARFDWPQRERVGDTGERLDRGLRNVRGSAG